ncbi:cytochrome P450 [Wilcoxina mikolae CBS 423.85]|nr:cytochrome P450 [Wilcoxina mikolae CBS 423.85]
MREGYQKYGKGAKAFKVATPSRYMVVFTHPKMVKELADLDDSIMSFEACVRERMSTDYVFSEKFASQAHHNIIIAKNLTNRLGSILPEAMSELIMAFEENTDIGPDWTSVNNFNVMLNCVARTTNRIFVGLPLCRDQEYLDNVIAFAIQVTKSTAALDMFPKFLKPFISNRDKALKKVMLSIGPIVEERRSKMQQFGEEWADKPNDAIQWILEAADPGESIRELCIQLLFLNFAAIHTSSFSITNVIFDLAAHTEYQEPLRQEIESVITEYGGWSKQALTAMKKLDSVLRESQRMNGVVLVTGQRKAMVSHTFSDGTHVPKGTLVFAPAHSLHNDTDIYKNPQEFDGFRFSRIREQPGQQAKHQMVATSSENIGFGTGKHACPGRFFAANELKMLLGYIISNYEFKFEDGKKRPENTFYAYSCIPDVSAKIMYRERADRNKSFANSCLPKGY